jgi:hypothetical protein
MKRQPKRLQINRDTIRALGEHELAVAIGGVRSVNICPDTEPDTLCLIRSCVTC